MASRTQPPPLPPRASHGRAAMGVEAVQGPANAHYSPYTSLAPDDPRVSSTQSLLSSAPAYQHDRRKLLLIYIHGFMGAETSFNSFPLHVHNYLTLSLADSYIVHSKIYPRYKSKKDMRFARDDFSRWLKPHESAETDVVLLGHSMGGLLAAEIALAPGTSTRSGSPFLHRILGTIHFDVPFLGMHPGIIGAGLSSMFRSKSPSHDSQRTRSSSNFTSPSVTTLQSQDEAPPDSLSTIERVSSAQSEEPPADPNFNPRFTNDVKLPVRKGWQSALHFINKHSDNLFQSSSAMIKSHIEFGGAMADYKGLLARYRRIRALDRDSEEARRVALDSGPRSVPRVRFVNYYTASTGRPPKETSPSQETSAQAEQATTSNNATNDQAQSLSSEDEDLAGNAYESSSELDASLVLEAPNSSVHCTFKELPLPEVPPEPTQPDSPDLTSITDPDVRKVVERHHVRLRRAYERDCRIRTALMKDRAKLQRKYASSSETAAGAERGTEHHEGVRTPNSAAASLESQQRGEATQDEGSHIRRSEDEEAVIDAATEQDRSEHASGDENTSQLEAVSSAEEPSRGRPSEARTKERTFCILPSANTDGIRDPTWVRVFMKDVDEVGAHCGLFVPSATYEMFVGEVSQRIEEWVREDLSRRAVEEHALGGLD